MWGVADCGHCIVRELCCHSALVLLCNHVLSRVEYLPVVVIHAVVIPIGVVSSVPVVCIHVVRSIEHPPRRCEPRGGGSRWCCRLCGGCA